MKLYVHRAVVSLLLVFSIACCAQAADEKIRVGVLGFESKADGVSQTQADIITDLFTQELAQSKTIAVYEREQLEQIGKEQKLGMSGLLDASTAVEIGKIAGLQYIILGSVTELSQKASGGGVAIFVDIKHQAQATVNIRVIEVATSQVKLALSETGTSTNSSTALVLGKNAAFVEGEFGGLEARAIGDAITKLGHALRAATTGESSHVIALTGDGYVIDVTSQEGSLYLIYLDGKSIVGMDGSVVAKEKIPLAVVKVRDVNPGHSTAVLADGCSGKLVQRGDKVEPISREKSKQLLDRKAFAKSRPSASEGTYEQIFGGKSDGNSPVEASASQTQEPALTQSDAGPLDQPAEEPAGAPAAPEARVIEGLDPNTSSDSKVIETYPLASSKRANLGIRHRGAQSLYSSGKYKQAFEAFVLLVEEYDGNYLSAYWAGLSAQKLNSTKEAAKWFDRAIAINPHYKPALDAKAKNSN